MGQLADSVVSNQSSCIFEDLLVPLLNLKSIALYNDASVVFKILGITETVLQDPFRYSKSYRTELPLKSL